MENWLLGFLLFITILQMSNGYPSSKESSSSEKLGLIDSDVDLVKIETEFRSTILPAPTSPGVEVESMDVTGETVQPTEDSPTFDASTVHTIDTGSIVQEDQGESPAESNTAPVQIDLDEASTGQESYVTIPDLDPNPIDIITVAIPITSPSEASPIVENEGSPLSSESDPKIVDHNDTPQITIEEILPKNEVKSEDIIEDGGLNLQFRDTNVNNITAKSDLDAEVVPGQQLIKHGVTYYIKNVEEDVCLTAHKHKFLPIGLLPGVVTTEEFAREGSQTWDAILGKVGPEVETEETTRTEARDSAYWLSPLSHSLNSVSVLRDPSKSLFPLKNFMNIVPNQDKSSFLLRSSVLQKCVQNEGKHRPIIFAPCDPSLTSQQWTAEFLYEDRKALTL